MTSIDIHSYRTVFDLERRIYRVDRLRLNPGGLPLRTLLYWLGLLTLAVVTARIPLLGAFVRIFPWYLRDLAAPAAGAGVLGMIRVEGRPFHLVVGSLLRYAVGPRHLAGMRRCARLGGHWRPPALLIVADGSEGRLRRLNCRGPGLVRVTPAHQRIEWELGVLGRLGRRAELTVSELEGLLAPTRAQPIVLAPGMRLRVR